MTFELSAKEMAAHAQAYQDIKQRPLSSEEMLHIAKLHEPAPEAVPVAAPEMAPAPVASPAPVNAPAPVDAPAPLAAPSPVADHAAAAPPAADPALQSAAQPVEMDSNMPLSEDPVSTPVSTAPFRAPTLTSMVNKSDATADQFYREADQRQHEADALANQSAAEGQDAVMTAAQATAEANKAHEVEYNKLSQAAAANEAKLNQIVEQGDAIAKAQMDRVQVASANAASTEMRDFWADKSTTGKVFAIISQTLAGAANFLSGQPGAETPLDKIIAQDMARQQHNLGLKKDAAAREKDILQDAYKSTGSRLAAQAAIADASYAKVDAAMKATAARLATPTAIAAAQKTSSEITAKRAELAQKAADNLKDIAVKESGQTGHLLAERQQIQQKATELQNKQAQQDTMQLEDVETPPGTPADYKERLATKVIEPAKDAIGAIDNLQRINRDKGLSGVQRYLQESQAQASFQIIEKARANFGGALSDSEKTLLEAVSGGSNLQKYAKFFKSPEYEQALDRLKLRMKESVNASLSYRGVKVREGSIFYLRHARPTAPAAAPAAQGAPVAAAQGEPDFSQVGRG